MARFATSDWHGRYDIYQEVKKFLLPDDIVYFLGDAIDRGPDGWKLMKAVYDDPQFVYIKGNHEDMFVKSFYTDKMIFRTIDSIDHTIEECLNIWINNGAEPTLKELLKESNQEIEEWVRKIKCLRRGWLIEDSACGRPIFLFHSGCWWDGYKDCWLWDRKHIARPWQGGIEGVYPDDTIIVHGHTPVLNMKHFISWNETPPSGNHAFWYCDEHKLDIDLGTYATGKTVLVNLDTWAETEFQVGQEGEY